MVRNVSDLEYFLEPHLELPASILDWGGNTNKILLLKRINYLIYMISTAIRMKISMI